MINKEQMFDRLLEADSSFQPQWEAFRQEWKEESDNVLYLALGELAQHIIRRLEQNEVVGLQEVFGGVESWHVDGDSYVREAASIGLLESIQNYLGGQEPNKRQRALLATIERHLGSESTRWWKKLYRYWDGDETALGFET